MLHRASYFRGLFDTSQTTEKGHDFLTNSVVEKLGEFSLDLDNGNFSVGISCIGLILRGDSFIFFMTPAEEWLL
jgi:hypothetical protein